MIEPVLELIAIAAGTKLHWPDFEMGRTQMLQSPHYDTYNVPIYPEFAMISDPEDAAPRITFGSERITLCPFWTGHRFMRMGYGPQTDSLVVWMEKWPDD
jgi:hypothetical protein